MAALGDNGRERGDDSLNDGPLNDREPYIEGDAPFEGDPFVEDARWDDDDEVTEELSLQHDDEPLPWLESDGFEVDEPNSGMGRLLLTFLIGLLAIGGVLYGLWYWSNRPDPALVADGSTIEAPDGPMKERPEDPGGKTFEGTGDVAPGVGEGRTREGRLATDGRTPDATASAAPRPSVDAAGSRAGTSGAASTATGAGSGTAAAAPAPGGVGVQVGAYSSRASAENGWTALTRQTDALSGVRHRIVEGEIESGKVFRLQAVPGDAAAANALCSRLKGQGIPCQVKN